MNASLAFIGFGEAGATFAAALRLTTEPRAFDIIWHDQTQRQTLIVRATATSVRPCETLADAIGDAGIVISVVTADSALAVAQEAARTIAPGALYLDMNSVAPDTKRAAAAAIDAAGGRYVDVAVMAPVEPARLGVPLLLSGPHAEAGTAALLALGFGNVRALAGDTGRASSIKMIRSVMVKGVEALTAEMMLGARAADVVDEVLASLGAGWEAKAAYNLERMHTHGRRRAAEMEESAKTLAALGVDPVMTRGTVVRQREMAA